VNEFPEEEFDRLQVTVQEPEKLEMKSTQENLKCEFVVEMKKQQPSMMIN
jgi:hypothetical protein